MSLNEIQLARDQHGYLPFLTKWSQNEPAASKHLGSRMRTDHWCKMKHKEMTFFTTDSKSKTNCYPGEFMAHEKGKNISITPHHGIEEGKMQHIGTKTFSQMFHEEVGRLPGASSKRDPRKSLLKTTANTRAKEQFEYWLKEPEPVKHGHKKWIGRGGSL